MDEAHYFDGAAYCRNVQEGLESQLNSIPAESEMTLKDFLLSFVPDYSPEYVCEVERRTRGQANNILWHKHRKHTICSSQASRFFSCSNNMDSQNKAFGDVIIGRASPKTGISIPMLQGSENEFTCFKLVEAFLPDLTRSGMDLPDDVDYDILTPGFFRLTNRPHIGCSPDLLVTKLGEERDVKVILELKCFQRCMIDDTTLPDDPIATLLKPVRGKSKLFQKSQSIVDGLSTHVESGVIKTYKDACLEYAPFIVTFKHDSFGSEKVAIDEINDIQKLDNGSLILAPFHKHALQMCLQKKAVIDVNAVKTPIRSYMVVALFSRTKDVGMELHIKGEHVCDLDQNKMMPLGLIFIPFGTSDAYMDRVLDTIDSNFAFSALIYALNELYDKGHITDESGRVLSIYDMLSILSNHYNVPMYMLPYNKRKYDQ